jgi:hypothetical protein
MPSNALLMQSATNLVRIRTAARGEEADQPGCSRALIHAETLV